MQAIAGFSPVLFAFAPCLSSIGINSRIAAPAAIAAGLWGRNGFTGWLPSLDSVPRFLRIEQAQNVFDRVQQLSGQPAAQK